MKSCPKCRLFVERCDCPPSAEATAVEQAFWDACVIGVAVKCSGDGLGNGTIARAVCGFADALVIERRERIAARAKGG